MSNTTTSTAADRLHVPLAITHMIDEVTFHLHADDTMQIERTSEDLATLSGRDAYALLTFMRMPAVVAFLEAQNVRRQTQSELSYQDDQAEKAA